MVDRPKTRGLGRGLSALMADVTPPTAAADTGQGASARRPDMMVPIEKVHPNPDQPRRTFTEEQLQELAASIKEKGIIQPLVVRERPGDKGAYEIVAGERRWRAAQIAMSRPDARVLYLVVELCGLTFRVNDTSKSNIIATALFGDGAAGAILGAGAGTLAGGDDGRNAAIGAAVGAIAGAAVGDYMEIILIG